MIIEKSERRVVASIEEGVQRRFRIDESGLVNIFNILRKNMYANPVRIIVQEYANNARDAHVAAKTPDRPIEITVPTTISPYLQIRDFGLGIPPNLIDEIFVSYGASTKRDSNDQIGGFGLGAKSAFSYCDAFEVTTICGGKKYIYAPHIDESDIGEMPLIAMEDCDEEPGTLISIPIVESDIYNVANQIAFICEYWDVRPNLIGSVNYANRKIYFKQDDWSLREKSYNWQTNEILYCVAGIPYTFNIPSTDARFTPQLKALAQCPFVVNVKTGEVTIASNRESLVSDPKTLDRILAILQDIDVGFRAHVLESLNNCEDFNEMLELRRMYSKLKLDGMVKEFNWNGIQISGESLVLNDHLGKVVDVELCHRGENPNAGFYLEWKKDHKQKLPFDENRHYYFYVLGKPDSVHKNQIINAFRSKETPDITKAHIIYLNVPLDHPDIALTGLDRFKLDDLSKFSDKPLWRVKRKGHASVRYDYYTFSQYGDKEKDKWNCAFGDLDVLDEGVMFPLRNREVGICDSQYKILNEFRINDGLKFYGFPVRAWKCASENPDLVHYLEYVQGCCTRLSNKIYSYSQDEIDIAASSSTHTVDSVYSCLKHMKKAKKFGKNNLFYRWLEYSKKFKDDRIVELRVLVYQYNQLAGLIKVEPIKTECGLKALHAECAARYPLLRYINSAMPYSLDEKSIKMMNQAASYIMMVEKMEKNKVEVAA